MLRKINEIGRDHGDVDDEASTIFLETLLLIKKSATAIEPRVSLPKKQTYKLSPL